ncbi:MAG: hypothetical protein EBZ99_06190, partial [Actinobacteria bacterium]|nr:hypothetical protein [Actinomycetota bacterium]
GPNGQITADDVTNSMQSANPATSPQDSNPAITHPDGSGITLIQLRGLRRQIATSMSEALRIPHITEFKEIDATSLMALRSELAPQFEKEGIKFSVTPLLMRACILALQNHPTFNARFDSEMGEIRQYDDINLGFATATEDGLIVPVMRKANDFTVAMLAKQTEQLAELAKTRKASTDQLGGGTFTVTNFGSFGTWLGTPIIRPPEVAIAGFGRAPTMLFTIWPPTKRFIVGIELIPYFIAIGPSSSVLSFTIFILPAYSLEISSNIGATALHGPHHSAQKSTRTGVSLFKTKSLNVAAVTFSVAIYLSSFISRFIASSNSSAQLRIVLRQERPDIPIQRR